MLNKYCGTKITRQKQAMSLPKEQYLADEAVELYNRNDEYGGRAVPFDLSTYEDSLVWVFLDCGVGSKIACMVDDYVYSTGSTDDTDRSRDDYWYLEGRYYALLEQAEEAERF